MVTLYDVAKSAGVSPKTVSRVMNGDGPVGKATRESVEAAMNALGYVPSSAARALRSARSGLIGVVSGAISDTDENPLLAGLPEIYILRGIQDVLDARGLTILLTDTGGRADAAPGLLRALAQHRVDGTIYVAPYHQQVALPPPAAVAAPLVVANGFADESTAAVTPDDYTGQRELVEGLIARGHRRIAYLQLPHALLATRHRTRAYEDAHRAAGIPLDPKLVVEADRVDCDAEARTAMLQRAIEAVLASAALPTAICCGNDRMALAVYGMLRARGLRVPEDISVAGYDDYRLISETLYPPLTTVALPYREIGRQAALMLTEPDKERGRVCVPGPVHWRESVTTIT
jgi:LacI family transcriptional regulator